MDADTLIEPDALLRMIRPFFLRRDVLAAGGIIRVVNNSTSQGGRAVVPHAPRRALVGFQVIEYLRAFLFGRLGWNLLGGNLIISGAFGLFRREAVIAANGYAHDTVGEDRTGTPAASPWIRAERTASGSLHPCPGGLDRSPGVIPCPRSAA